MSDVGVTASGFQIKSFQDILNDKASRAQDIFGPDVDLRSTSALAKILQIGAAEDQELWKKMETLYYSNFISTASGVSLDLLGEDLGVARRFLCAQGKVSLTLSGEAPGRIYNLPVGTLIETDAPVQQFRTNYLVSLSSQNKQAAAVDVTAVLRGPSGNVAAGTINKINTSFAARLNLGGALIAVKNAAPTDGGDVQEDDEIYRSLLLGRPRTLWTLEAVRSAVKAVDGVRDCRVFDPLGGVDVSQSIFQLFAFGGRHFGTQRFPSTPYFFDIIVALYPGFEWETDGTVHGTSDDIEEAIAQVRPISIFPNLRLANNVFVGMRANVLIKSGHDQDAVTAAIKDKLEQRVNGLGLGGTVLFSEVMHDCMEVAGVIDVQQLHLRRTPPLLATISFGGTTQFQATDIELAVGENLPLQQSEVAVFNVDSRLIDLEVSDR